MTPGIAVVAFAGAVTSLFTGLATAMAVKRGRMESARAAPSVWLWSLVTAFAVMFTLVRLAHLFSVPRTEWIFYAQTVAGASTVVALTWILIGVAFGHHWSRFGAELAALAAAVILTLVFTHGLIGPFHDEWSFEYLPASAFARWAIFAVYVALPVLMSGLAVWATRDEPDRAFRRKIALFSGAVVLLFVPNAIKYVKFFDGTSSIVLAGTMVLGAWLGWRSYHST